ncbi:MAG: ribosome maturation factor RimP [Cyanobacteriota bacterium]
MTKPFNKKINKVNVSVNKAKILDTLIPIVEETAEKLGLTVLEVSFNREHGKYFLRIFIYSEKKPITHGECSDLTRSLSCIIDETDLIPVPYALEISSPGINRKLKNPVEFDVFKGKTVKVILKKPEEKNNVFTGELIGLTEDMESAIIKVEEATKVINLSDIKTIQLDE